MTLRPKPTALRRDGNRPSLSPMARITIHAACGTMLVLLTGYPLLLYLMFSSVVESHLPEATQRRIVFRRIFNFASPDFYGAAICFAGVCLGVLLLLRAIWLALTVASRKLANRGI
jgi:hypothetical protein